MDRLKNRIQKNISKMDVDEPGDGTWNNLKQALSKSVESDPFKTHIQENRIQLEIDSPPITSWDKISGAISTKKLAPVWPVKNRLIYLSAACILTVICFGVLRFVNRVKPNHDTEAVTKLPSENINDTKDSTNLPSTKSRLIVEQPSPILSPKQEKKHQSEPVATLNLQKKEIKNSLPPVVMQIEKDYDQLIAAQIAYTKSLAVYGENASYFQEFMNDFKALDKQEKQLRTSIGEHGLQGNNIDDLGMIYQQKLTVLKKLQNEINKTSNRNKNLTDTVPTYLSL